MSNINYLKVNRPYKYYRGFLRRITDFTEIRSPQIEKKIFLQECFFPSTEMSGLSLCFTWALAVFAFLTPVQSSPFIGPEPIRCAPCTPEQLGQCPAVPTNCREVLREPGCGCCLACALEKGDSCGVYTAHCATGLRCSPRPGDPKPLHSLTRGHGICTDLDEGEGVTSFLSLIAFLPLACLYKSCYT